MSKDRNICRLTSKARREVLVKLGRFTAVSAPAMTILLAAQTKPASAVTSQNCSAIAQSDKTKFS